MEGICLLVLLCTGRCDGAMQLEPAGVRTGSIQCIGTRRMAALRALGGLLTEMLRLRLGSACMHEARTAT